MKTTRSGNDNDDDNRNNDGLYSSSHVSLKSASRKYYQNGEKNGDSATDLLRLASVQKFPHPITSVKFTRHRERDLKMEIYNKGGRVDGTTKTNKMKVMARVDDIVRRLHWLETRKARCSRWTWHLVKFYVNTTPKRVTEMPSRRLNLTQFLTLAILIAAVVVVLAVVVIVKVEAVTKKWSRRESSWERPMVR